MALQERAMNAGLELARAKTQQAWDMHSSIVPPASVEEFDEQEVEKRSTFSDSGDCFTTLALLTNTPLAFASASRLQE